MPQIPNPAQPGEAGKVYIKLKQNLKASGFGYKLNREGARLVKTTKYSWPSYTLKMVVPGGTKKIVFDAGYFCAYVYTYPEYETRYVNVTRTDDRFSQYYEDNIDEVLGGPKETLGD